MDFIWANLENKYNQRLEFKLNLERKCDTLTICAVDFYQVYLDEKLVCYGPSRTASGFVRPRMLDVKGVKTILVKTVSYGVNNYMCDFQQPFFGAELSIGEKVVYNTSDFECFVSSEVVINAPRFSGQRGFVEIFDFNRKANEKVEIYSVKSPKIISELEDFADYRKISPNKINSGAFVGFDYYREIPTNHDSYESCLSVKKDLIEKNWDNYRFNEYLFERIFTGFIEIDITTDASAEIFVFFEEYCENGKWTFRRSGCNEFVLIKVPSGKHSVITFEPYSFKHLKIVYNCDGNIAFSSKLITLENKFAKLNVQTKDDKINVVMNAALNTFKQNAIDIFMDCPSRERAGWLCDSYFTGKSENFFCGNNKIERAFIENILIAKTPEIDEGMLPKCFPAEHGRNLYIPNWAMWFVIEILDYYKRTGDKEIVELAKEKIFLLIEFFKKYQNEYGLLENLPSWVFIEWSVCNSNQYTCGVNFPSNMLYAYMLKCTFELYGDYYLKEQYEQIAKTITEMSFNGEFFCDNAVRKNGVLYRCDEHISETCQYYALYTGFCPSEDYMAKIILEFGPTRKDSYPEIGKSNMFIGNYLRLLWLKEQGEYKRIYDESIDYFYDMAKMTGTLWEHNRPSASCNHGFASVVAYIIYECLDNL